MASLNIKDCVRSMDITFRSGKAMMVKGAPGIGKSEMGEQYAAHRYEELNGEYFYGVLNAATANLAAIMGFLVPTKKTYLDTTYLTGEWTYPYFFNDQKTRRPASSYKNGMIHIEEWGQGIGDVKRSLADLVHARHVGDHWLPPGFDILITSNRPEDRSGTTKEYDFLINRWNEVTLIAELEPLIEHFLLIGISEVSMAFAVNHVDTVLHSAVTETQQPWCTPRSLVGMDRWLAEALRQGISLDDPIVPANIEGIIGTGACAQFLAHARLRMTLPDFHKEIVPHPDTCRVPHAADAQLMLCYSMAAQVKRDILKPVVQYAKRLPDAFGVTFVRSALKKQPQLVNTKEIGDWARDNVLILAAIQ